MPFLIWFPQFNFIYSQYNLKKNMTNEEIIEEILVKSHELGVRNKVLNISKKISKMNPKMDRVYIFEAAFKLAQGKGDVTILK